MNVIDYLSWRGDLSFAKDELNEVDALIFAWLSYYQFENFDRKLIVNQKLKDVPIVLENSKIRNILPYNSASILLDKAVKTSRYQNIKITDFQNIFDTNQTIQFFAISFEIDQNTDVIAFRGTDISAIGWKEDCYLALLDKTGAQDLALQFLENQPKDKKLIVVGHSKGGNLALFASIFAKENQKNISAIYNFDGPGFREKMQEKAEYLAIKNKIKTYIPSSSIVGMLLEHEENFEVIKSKGLLALQHDSMLWQVLGNQFEKELENNFFSQTFNKAFASFLNCKEFDDNVKKDFVETIFLNKNNLNFNKEKIENLKKTGIALLQANKTIKNSIKKKIFDFFAKPNQVQISKSK